MLKKLFPNSITDFEVYGSRARPNAVGESLCCLAVDLNEIASFSTAAARILAAGLAAACFLVYTGMTILRSVGDETERHGVLILSIIVDIKLTT